MEFERPFRIFRFERFSDVADHVRKGSVRIRRLRAREDGENFLSRLGAEFGHEGVEGFCWHEGFSLKGRRPLRGHLKRHFRRIGGDEGFDRNLRSAAVTHGGWLMTNDVREVFGSVRFRKDGRRSEFIGLVEKSGRYDGSSGNGIDGSSDSVNEREISFIRRVRKMPLERQRFRKYRNDVMTGIFHYDRKVFGSVRFDIRMVPKTEKIHDVVASFNISKNREERFPVLNCPFPRARFVIGNECGKSECGKKVVEFSKSSVFPFGIAFGSDFGKGGGEAKLYDIFWELRARKVREGEKMLQCRKAFFPALRKQVLDADNFGIGNSKGLCHVERQPEVFQIAHPLVERANSA